MGGKPRKKLVHPEPPINPALTPHLSTLVKLGSIAVHAQELTEPGGHPVDRIALKGLLEDSEVVAWIKAMGAWLPEKRL